MLLLCDCYANWICICWLSSGDSFDSKTQFSFLSDSYELNSAKIIISIATWYNIGIINLNNAKKKMM